MAAKPLSDIEVALAGQRSLSGACLAARGLPLPAASAPSLT